MNTKQPFSVKARRFWSLRDGAEEYLKIKFPRWKPKTPQERETKINGAMSYLMDVEMVCRFPKLGYDSIEAIRRAKAGSDDDLCRLMVCCGRDLLATWPFVMERYRRAYEERDNRFMLMFWSAAYDHRKTFSISKRRKRYDADDNGNYAEIRPQFTAWLLLNREMRLTMTAKEILDKWEAHKKKHGITEISFTGPNREHNFHRWASQIGFTLGHKNRPRQR